MLAFPYGTMEVVVAQKITARQNKFEKSSGCVAQVVNVNFVGIIQPKLHKFDVLWPLNLNIKI